MGLKRVLTYPLEKGVLLNPFERSIGTSGIPRTNLLAYYRGGTDTIGESTVLLDRSGNGYHATIVSGTSWADWVITLPAEAALIAADTYELFYTAGVPNEVAISTLRTNHNNHFYCGSKGLACYGTRHDKATAKRTELAIGINNWATSVPQWQANDLLRFFYDTDGPNWTSNTNWQTSGDVSTWFGITVFGGVVTRINLTANGLKGPGLQHLSELTSLTHLMPFNNAALSGTTADLSGLINITMMYLNNCKVLGEIDLLNKLTKVRQLSLPNTGVTGNIAVLSNFPLLNTAQINTNNIFGDVSVVESIPALEYFTMFFTNVSGSLSSFSSKTTLKSVAVYSTQISTYTSGTLPAWNNITLQIQDLGLDQTEVDNFLCDLAAAGGTGGLLNISGTNAAPSATGTACKDTLVSQGRAVTVTA